METCTSRVVDIFHVRDILRAFMQMARPPAPPAHCEAWTAPMCDRATSVRRHEKKGDTGALVRSHHPVLPVSDCLCSGPKRTFSRSHASFRLAGSDDAGCELATRAATALLTA
jgi:hypothetical protein